MEESIDIESLDHVAIRVKDLELSANWYETVLGLKKYKLEKWGEFPIFMLANKSGVALFPANLNDDSLNQNSKNVKIDHFAFCVNKQNFEKAIKKYEALGLQFHIQDHYYFDSIYTKDPDGHTVELTSIKVDEKEFYK
ncbi:MAG: VOC family protein [Bacteroidota bacterium]